MKKTNRSIIDTYSTMYFVDIVVANEYTTLEELKELYTYMNKKELDDDILNGQSTVSTVIRKSDNVDCILVKYNRDATNPNINIELDRVNTVCHEATHVALDIYEAIGQDVCFCSPEPFCYLVGYAGECIYNTLNKQ